MHIKRFNLGVYDYTYSVVTGTSYYCRDDGWDYFHFKTFLLLVLAAAFAYNKLSVN